MFIGRSCSNCSAFSFRATCEGLNNNPLQYTCARLFTKGYDLCTVKSVLCISLSYHPSLLLRDIDWTLTRRIDSYLGTGITPYEVENKLNSKFLKVRQNTIKTVLLVGICFVVCWGNDEIYYLMYNLGYNADWNRTVNPFVYLFSFQDYQMVFKEFSLKPKSVQRDV